MLSNSARCVRQYRRLRCKDYFKDYFKARKLYGSVYLCSDSEQALDELRLTQRITSV
jgi:hypothetical protein